MTATQIMKEIMKSRKMSMAEMGRRLDTSTQTIYERLKEDKHNITVERLIEMLNELDYRVMIVPDYSVRKLSDSYVVNRKRTK